MALFEPFDLPRTELQQFCRLTRPARRFGFADHSGRIAAAMDADLTVFSGDPATDISALSHVSYTIRAGKLIYLAHPQAAP